MGSGVNFSSESAANLAACVPGLSAASPGGSGEYTVPSTVVVASSYISH